MTATLETAHLAICDLVRQFQANQQTYLSLKYQEAEARKDFIDKFFKALGWDVDHDTQTNPAEQEVKIERGVAVAAEKKRADYAFHFAPNYRDVRFFVEAKKPSTDLARNADAHFQTLRYGWNANTPLAVLTDFEQFYILDCRAKPSIHDALQWVHKVNHYTDFLDRETFAGFYWLFSRQAFTDGTFDRYVEALPKRKSVGKQMGMLRTGNQPVDQSFLSELEEYREAIAKAFNRDNPMLDGFTLTEVTQRVLDRLVFLRFLEDKLIENDITVGGVARSESPWRQFVTDSRRLNARYNGGVYRSHPLIDSGRLNINEDDFRAVCEALSAQYSPYDFNAIPIHILGSIYERFLGRVIVSSTAGVEVEEKPEVRKAGGVYYTPEYVVRYIVDTSVGVRIVDKTPDQIAKMRFADIACGSGSFLLNVFDTLLRYHTHYFNDHPDRAERAGCVQTEDGTWRLSLQQRRQILLNNVYGVDIDRQAVEVTQISLYLKLLEEETTASAHQYELQLHETLLPDLRHNIVCGNSLIGTDILEGQAFATEEERALNPMNFDDAFPEIMGRGGFDAIVGNPPYGALAGGSARKHLSKRYFAELGTEDFYAIFVAKAVDTLRLGGDLSFIVPSAWLGGPAYAHFREYLLRQTIVEIVELPFDVFVDAYIDTCIFRLRKAKCASDHSVRTFRFQKRVKISSDQDIRDASFDVVAQSRWLSNPDMKFVLGRRSLDLLESVRTKATLTFGDSVAVKRGVLFDRSLLTSSESSANSYRYFVGDVYRYQLNLVFDGWIEFDDRMTERPRELRWFQGARILLRRLVNRQQRLMASFADETFITNKNLYSLIAHKEDATLFALGLLNSRLFSYLYISQVSQATKDDFPQVTIRDLISLPYVEPSVAIRDKMVHCVEQLLEYQKTRNEAVSEADTDYWTSRCDAVDRQIDALVYDLYGLTDNEIAIVEGRS